MKYLKMLGLLAVAAGALMAFAGTASATITNNGAAYTGEIKAQSFNTKFDGPVEWGCLNMTVAGNTTNGGTTYALTTVAFTECTDTVTVLKKGHWRFASDGTLYWEALEFTVQLHRTVLGFPVTTHCIYETEALPGTDVGTLEEGTTTINLIGTNIPQTKTDGNCGANANMTGKISVIKPGALTID